MTDFDSFATQLLEEAKALLEKSKTTDGFTQVTFLHSSLFLGISALEASVNSITEELLIEPYDECYTVYERALLREKEVYFDRGEYVLGKGLKMSRITDRLEFLFFKFSGKKLDGTVQWYFNLKESIGLRNKLVHPKENIELTAKQVEVAILAVVEAINQLYTIVYKRKYPAYDMGIQAKENLA